MSGHIRCKGSSRSTYGPMVYALAHIADGKGMLISRNGNVFRGVAEPGLFN